MAVSSTRSGQKGEQSRKKHQNHFQFFFVKVIHDNPRSDFSPTFIRKRARAADSECISGYIDFDIPDYISRTYAFSAGGGRSI